MHCVTDLMFIEQSIKIIRAGDFVAIHAENNVSDCKVTILSLRDTAQARIRGGLAWRNLQDDHAVRDRQIKLTLQRLNIARADSQLRPAYFTRPQ